jgi:hypothetical protein
MSGTSARIAMEWLAAVAPGLPVGVGAEPARDHPPAGRRWDVLILPGELGYLTLDVLTRPVDRPGPVLSGSGECRMGFLVPPGTAGRWLGTGIRTAGQGTWIVVPYPGRTAGRVRWLIPPDGSGTLTDPSLLELAMHEAAVGLARGGGD